MAGQHVVWDWNGTLLDDLPIVIEAVNVTVVEMGGPKVDEEAYRTHYTRPVQKFYEGLLERSISEAEWHVLNDSYHERYYSAVHRAPLTTGAAAAMDLVENGGWSQSLLSMTPQEKLEQIVEGHGLLDRLDPVTGLPSQTGGHKTEHLIYHLERQQLSGSQVVMIGDTPDDVVAARAVGARAVLYDGGSHHRHQLDMIGVPVAETLVEAVKIALRR